MTEWKGPLCDTWHSLNQGDREGNPEGDGAYMVAQDEGIAIAFRLTCASLEGHLVTVVKG